MSVRILAAALALSPPTPAQVAACTPARTTPAAAATAPLQPKRLSDLPPGYLMRAVLRRVGPCNVSDVRKDGAWVHILDGVAPTTPAPANR
jgi:hypothetical protein